MTTGMVIMRPTSIVVAGGGSETASIRAAGGVEFANATSLSLNGVFTSDYDDYMVVVRGTSSAGVGLGIRLRTSGTDATATNYTRQTLNAYGTTVNSARATSDSRFSGGDLYNTQRGGFIHHLYGPYLSQPTAHRMVSSVDYFSATIFDASGTHSLSTSYDGFTLYLISAGPNITGQLTVFGLAQ
jgi:hypothetical protein